MKQDRAKPLGDAGLSREGWRVSLGENQSLWRA